jgi:hypothetical protein
MSIKFYLNLTKRVALPLFTRDLFPENLFKNQSIGVLQAKSCREEGRQGLKVYIFDHSTGTLGEIDFIKFC